MSSLIRKFDCCQKIGDMQFRDISSSAIACLAAFLKLNGLNLSMDSLLDVAPISQGGMSDRLLCFYGRRLGIKIDAVDINEIKNSSTEQPILIQRDSGYSFLLLKVEADGFLVGLPGYPESFALMPFESDILDNIRHAYVLTMLVRGPFLRKVSRPPKFWLIEWQPEFEGKYDTQAVAKQNKFFLKNKYKENTPLPLDDISSRSLRKSHQAICKQLPRFYGKYRDINLKRGATVFVDHPAIPHVLEELLSALQNRRISSLDEAIPLVARFFTDFQTIHPFTNANRRMAILVITKYLERWDAKINWDNISATQFYYWIRCARQGHFRFLETGFRDNLLRSQIEEFACA